MLPWLKTSSARRLATILLASSVCDAVVMRTLPRRGFTMESMRPGASLRPLTPGSILAGGRQRFQPLVARAGGDEMALARAPTNPYADFPLYPAVRLAWLSPEIQ